MAYRIPEYTVKLVREKPHSSEVKKLSGPRDAAEVARILLEDSPCEKVIVLLLDAQQQVRGMKVVTVGTVDTSLVHPREVFRSAILSNATAIIIAHNHPSGNPEPSAEDRAVTRQLVQAGSLIGIPVLDHVIIGEDGKFASFQEMGILPHATPF